MVTPRRSQQRLCACDDIHHPVSRSLLRQKSSLCLSPVTDGQLIRWSVQIVIVHTGHSKKCSPGSLSWNPVNWERPISAWHPARYHKLGLSFQYKGESPLLALGAAWCTNVSWSLQKGCDKFLSPKKGAIHRCTALTLWYTFSIDRDVLVVPVGSPWSRQYTGVHSTEGTVSTWEYIRPVYWGFLHTGGSLSRVSSETRGKLLRLYILQQSTLRELEKGNLSLTSLNSTVNVSFSNTFLLNWNIYFGSSWVIFQEAVLILGDAEKYCAWCISLTLKELERSTAQMSGQLSQEHHILNTPQSWSLWKNEEKNGIILKSHHIWRLRSQIVVAKHRTILEENLSVRLQTGGTSSSNGLGHNAQATHWGFSKSRTWKLISNYFWREIHIYLWYTRLSTWRKVH